jgi:ZIP family zinc transporter
MSEHKKTYNNQSQHKYLSRGVVNMNNALWWSFLAGFSTSIGAALLFLNKKWRPRHLAYFLSLAAGVMTAVVFFDMLPSALVSGSSKALSGVVIGLLLMFLTAGIQHQGIHSTQTLVAWAI